MTTVQGIHRSIYTYSIKVTGDVAEMGTVGRIQVWRNAIMDLKDAIMDLKDTKQRTNKTGEKKDGWICWFSSEYYLSLLGCGGHQCSFRFLAEFRCAFMCV